MKTVGIVGGIAPASTMVYYQEIIASFRARIKEDKYPNIILNSIDLRRMLNLIEQNRLDALREYICDSLCQLAGAGADFGFFAANTPHMIFAEIEAQSPLPLVSIVSETAGRAQERGLGRLALFGKGFTMQQTFYPEAFAAKNIAVVVPAKDEQDYIHSRYMSEFVPGIFKDETRAEFIRIVRTMQDRSGIDALVLGGTELSLILSDESQVSLPILDTTRIHIDAVVDQMVR